MAKEKKNWNPQLTGGPVPYDDDSTIAKLESACLNLKTLLHTSSRMGSNLEKMETSSHALEQTLTTASKRIALPQLISIAKKALDTRINSAVALSLFESFMLCETLQRKLTCSSTNLANEILPKKRVWILKEYMECDLNQQSF